MEIRDEASKRVRVRRGREEIEGIVAAFVASGQSQAAFARERGLNPKSLRNWLRKSGEASAPGSLREVVVKAEPRRALAPADRGGAAAAPLAAVVVRTARGLEVELPLCAGLGWIERMVKEVARS